MDANLVVSLISKVRRDSSRYIEKELAAAGVDGIVASHGAILGALFRNEGELMMKKIAELTGRDKSTVTYLIKGLAEAGYVIRKKGCTDSRETYVCLTPKGWDIRNKITSVSERLIHTAYIGFTENEKRNLMALLQKMDQNFLEN